MTTTVSILRVAPTATLSKPSFLHLHHAKPFFFSNVTPINFFEMRKRLDCLRIQTRRADKPIACLVFSSSSAPKTRLYVSGLSFRTTEESLRNAFQNFGELVEVNLIMDNIANRPRGFAFLRYATEAESQNAIEGMHGKFLDGRVIFVEVAKPRSELRKSSRNNQRRF